MRVAFTGSVCRDDDANESKKQLRQARMTAGQPLRILLASFVEPSALRRSLAYVFKA
jgi:hypothetical protein